MKACTVCGFSNSSTAAVCQACGTALVIEAPTKARAGEAVCAQHSETPAIAACDRCGTFYCAACLERASDNKLYCEACRARFAPLPWDKRADLGIARAWWQTATLMLRAPIVTLKSAQRDASLGSSILYAMIATAAGFATTFVMYGLLFAGMYLFGLNETREMGGASSAVISVVTGVFVFAFYAVGIFIFQLAMLMGFSGLEHVILKMFGERNLSSYSVTVRAHALGLSPYVLGLIPFCGVFVMGLWSMITRCLTLAELQRVSPGKAVGAVVAPMVVMCGGIIALYALIIAVVVSTIGKV